MCPPFLFAYGCGKAAGFGTPALQFETASPYGRGRDKHHTVKAASSRRSPKAPASEGGRYNSG